MDPRVPNLRQTKQNKTKQKSLSVEVCYDIEILTSNIYLAVIFVYLKYLSAVYLPLCSKFHVWRTFLLVEKMTTKICFES